MAGMKPFSLIALAWGSLAAAAEIPVSMGHHHVNTGNLEASKTFWKQLGAEVVPFGTYTVMRLPDLLVFLREQEPTGGTRGTTVNHVGLRLKDVRGKIAALKSAAVPVITREELADAKEDVYFHPVQKTYLAFVLSPDGTKVELFEDKNSPDPAANHHIHFSAPDVLAMRAWYVETFGAAPGQRGGMEAAQLPGVNLTFSPAPGEVSGTKGRSVDHIGFEVEGLKALCEKLEAKGVRFDRPYTERPEIQAALAFLYDPWGTYIELTEGLEALKIASESED
jgi:catechol 2,3-dioxygenase-like lactoylglutathione lyase family enzyme